METKDKINSLFTKIKDLEESIKEKTDELNKAIDEYESYLTELFKSRKIDALSFGWFSTMFCRFSEEQGEYITDFDKDDVLTFFGENEDGKISQLFDIEISNMLQENGCYCKLGFRELILDRIYNDLELGSKKIYYTTDIDESITEIVFK